MQARLSFSTLFASVLALMAVDLDKLKPGTPEHTKLRLKAHTEARRQYQAQGDIRNAIAHRNSPAKRAKLRARR